MDTPTLQPINQERTVAGSLRRRWLDALIAASSDLVLAFDPQLQITLTNSRAAELLGRNEEDLLGTRIEVCGAVGAILTPALLEVLDSKTYVQQEHEIPEGDLRRTFEASYSPVMGEQSEVLGILLILREVTDRQTALRRLAVSRERLETQAKALEVFDVVSESDLSGQIHYANDKFCMLSQYSRKELLGNNYRLVNSGYHSKSFFQKMWRTISRGHTWVGEIRNRAKDGSYYWVQTIITPILDEERKVTRFLSIQRNITQAHDRSVQVDDLLHQFRQSYDLIPLLMVRLDLDRNTTFCNRAFLETTGFLEEDVLENNWLQIFTSMDQRQDVQEEFLHLLGDRKKEAHFQMQIHCQNGQTKTVKWIASALKNLEGVATGIQLIGEEPSPTVTSLKTVRSVSDLDQGRDIIGFVSHELKGGLTSIECGLQTIQEQLPSPNVPKSELSATLRKVMNKVRQLERLSRNLLENLARANRGLQVTYQPISLRALILGTWERFKEDLPADRFNLNIDLPSEDVVVEWDPIGIEQVISNLLRNAAQYSKPEGGRISLRASLKEDRVLIEIVDQGIGIPPENLESIFHLFTRGTNTEQKEIKSFGVGLKFCKDVVTRHQGRIWVESKLGEGTAIYLLLPVDPKVSRLV